jgi:NitT/TauT family transport system substrate-binding protein
VRGLSRVRGSAGLVAALLTLSVLAMSACGGSAAGTGGSPAAKPAGSPSASGSTAAPGAAAKRLRNVTLQLPWLVAGYDAPFYVARDKGWYRDAGLNVTITPGRSSLGAAEIVAGGKAQYGFVDGGAMAGIVSRGGHEIMLACLEQESPVGLVHSKDVPVRTARDLKGKTIFANAAGGPVVQFLNAVLSRAGMTQKDVHLQIVDATAEASTFETHPQDIMLSFENSAYPAIVQKMPSAVFTPYADLGVNVLSLGIVANTDELKSHPDSAKAFVQASLKGFQFALDHPKQAIAIMAKDDPSSNRFVLQKSLEVSLPLLHTPATQGKPLGWMAASDWKTSLDLLHRYSTLKVIKPLSSYYTNEFVGGSQA